MASANCSSKRKLRQNKAASAAGPEIREISEELFVIEGNSASQQSDPAAEVVQLQKQRQRRRQKQKEEYSRSCTGSFLAF